MRTGSVRLFGKTHDVADQVRDARRQLIERLHAETQRQLGRGAELERILFVGGGAVALADDIRDWFPNQTIAPHPAFANARGMLKYLRYVCQEPSLRTVLSVVTAVSVTPDASSGCETDARTGAARQRCQPRRGRSRPRLNPPCRECAPDRDGMFSGFHSCLKENCHVQ